ncbi:hypothetical protein DPMN_107654 [Dreissena polymorpha]|uniref:Uncharacterized protein n=1 Tax=Dreissena polymorpha TaxID=45954 RepID=A0A9D4QK55_DREPO|nr:hypothetical protein DPMN_107654 [Dreissena polymorpha]
MVVNIDFSELLPIAKSLEEMRCKMKNEEALVKEMDLLQQDITQKEEEIKQLNSFRYEDRNKWKRQLISQ